MQPGCPAGHGRWQQRTLRQWPVTPRDGQMSNWLNRIDPACWRCQFRPGCKTPRPVLAGVPQRAYGGQIALSQEISQPGHVDWTPLIEPHRSSVVALPVPARMQSPQAGAGRRATSAYGGQVVLPRNIIKPDPVDPYSLIPC